MLKKMMQSRLTDEEEDPTIEDLKNDMDESNADIEDEKNFIKKQMVDELNEMKGYLSNNVNYFNEIQISDSDKGTKWQKMKRNLKKIIATNKNPGSF